MREMTENAKAYLSREENLWFDVKKQAISLCKIFKWYAIDFGQGNDQVNVGWSLNVLRSHFWRSNLKFIGFLF